MAVRKMKNGTYAFRKRGVDWSGKSVQGRGQGFKLKKEAQDAELKFLDNLKTGEDITFNRLVKLYLENHKLKVRETTYNNVKLVINSRILPYFKHYKIKKITPVIVREWQKTMIAENFSATYLRMLNCKLKAIFNFAKRYHGLIHNPVELTDPVGAAKAHSMQIWTLEDFKKVMEVEAPRGVSLLLNFLFNSGCRVGEALALKIEDIDLTNNNVIINKTYTRLKGNDYVGKTKTGQTRTIKMPESILKEMLEYNKKNTTPGRIFQFSKSFFEKEFKIMTESAGVKKIRIHDLRHSHASFLINSKIQDKIISERLGHTSIQMTLDTYSHLYPDAENDVLDLLNKI